MDDSKEDIMEATYTALSKHGYANLSIQKIADESDKGKSLIYYHYENKNDLLLSFLDYITHHLEKTHTELEGEPREKLDELLDMTLGIKNDEQWKFHKSLLEIKAQASHQEEFQNKLLEIDEMITENVAEIMAELEVEEPRSAAEILVSCIEGSVNRKVSAGDREGLKELKENIREVVEEYLVKGC